MLYACFGAMAQEQPQATFACSGEIIARGGASRIGGGTAEVRSLRSRGGFMPLPCEMERNIWCKRIWSRPAGRVAATAAASQARAVELLSRGNAARRAKLGLWANPYYDLLDADNPADVLAEQGAFALVEGKVVSVRESGATIYVNFGRRWTEDFTVTILKRNERIFTAAGLEPKKLAGRRIRVRGWIEERGGPWIEAARPEQIELTDRE